MVAVRYRALYRAVIDNSATELASQDSIDRPFVGVAIRGPSLRMLKLRDSTTSDRTEGVVLYDGDTIASFGEAPLVVPIRALWQTS